MTFSVRKGPVSEDSRRLVFDNLHSANHLCWNAGTRCTLGDLVDYVESLSNLSKHSVVTIEMCHLVIKVEEELTSI